MTKITAEFSAGLTDEIGRLVPLLRRHRSLYPPMLKWVVGARKVHRFDIAVMGHWHQLLWHPDVFVNGSLKGEDELALKHKFAPERAQQHVFVVTPENGVTIQSVAFAD